MGLIVPSFAGQQLFGWPVTMYTEDTPRAKQINSFPGINGVEVLDLGFRLRQTIANGRLTGGDESELAAAVGIFRSFNDGGAYDLYTTKGEFFEQVQLHLFAERPRVFYDPTLQIVFQHYTATFWHLLG